MGEPLQVLEGSDLEISHLFPKCRPRISLSPSKPLAATDTCKSDLNLNYVHDSDDNDNYELPPNHTTVSAAFDEDLTTQDCDDSSVSSASRMSVDSATATSSSTPASQSESHSSASSHSAQVERSLADLSVVSAYRDFEEPVARSSVLDSSYEDSPSHSAAPTQTNSVSKSHNLPHVRQEHFRLRDSRIEAAGGREVFRQSRSRPARRRHEETRTANHNRPHHHLHLHHSHHANYHLQQLQQPSQHLSRLLIEDSRRTTNSSRSNSTSSSSSTSSNSTNNSSSISGSQASHSTESGQANDEHHSGDAHQASTQDGESPKVYEARLAGSTEVVFDDIGEWVTRGLTVRGLQEHSLKGKQASAADTYIHSLSHSDPESDSDSEQALARVTKIGNVPIAEYEGSPRRYGPRADSRHHSPRTLHLLTGMHRTPRPGFPRRITSSDDHRSKEALLQKDKVCQPVWEKPNPPLPSHKEKVSPTIERHFKDKLSANPAQERKSPSRKSKSHSSKVRTASPLDKNMPRAKNNLDELHKLLSVGRTHEYVNQKHTAVLDSMPDDAQEEENVSVTTMPPILSVSSEPYDPEDTKSGDESGTSTPPVISISTLSSTYSSTLNQQQPSPISCDNYADNYEFSFEVSETRKVLEEFFKDPENKMSQKDFSDLEYTLRRHHGNSYVGQRLAAGYEDEAQADEEECVGDFKNVDEPSEIECLEKERRVDECTNANSSVIHENGDSLHDHEMEVSRNFTLSPETTSCDSGDVESEFSAGEAEGSLHSSSRGLCSTMPVLEDGLSSGEESDIVQDQNCYLSADNIHNIELTHHPLIEQQLLNQRSNNIQSERFPNNQVINLDHNLEIEQNSDEEDEKLKVYQRTRSLDEQLCRGELPPSANNFQASPITVANSSNGLSPTESYSCNASSPTSHVNSHKLNSCCEEQLSNHHSSQGSRNSLPNNSSQHGKFSNCSNSTCNKVISSHYGGNHSPSSSTLSLMKKQITEIEREIALKRPEATLTRVDGELPQPPLDLHLLDPLTEKMGEPPPPPAPHPHRNSNEVADNDASAHDHATTNNVSPSRTTGHIHSPQYTPVSCPIPSPQLISSLGSITSPGQVTPHMVPGHPATHDLQHKPGSAVSPSRESVEAAIADIKQAIKRTKNLPLKSHHPQQEKHAPDKQPVWVPRSNRREQSHSQLSNPTSPQIQPPHRSSQHHCHHQQQQQESSPSAGSTQSRDKSIHDEDDGDTDQETDRLLGQQRSDEPGFVEDKSWSRPKGRSVMPRYLAPSQKENECEEGSANSAASSPPTPVIQSHICSSKPAPSSPQDLSSNKTKSKKEKDTSKKKGRSKEVMIHEPAVLIEGVLFRARYLGSTQLVSEGQPTKTTRMMQAEEAVSRIKAPEGEAQPSTEVDLFISTEKIMVLNTDLKEIMMDHALRSISYIADIGDLVVLMARRRVLPTEEQGTNGAHKTPKMICHVFESDEAQFIAQSIGQAFQVAYLEFLKANGIEDHSFVKEMDYQEVLNSQEIFGDELQMFAKKELQKEVVVPKMKGEILGVVVVESGWGSMVPTVVIANLSPTGAAAKCGQLNIGDQIIAINGISLVGLPLSTCQNYIKNTKYNTAVKLTVVPCPPVVEVKIRRPDTKYQLGFSVQNGVICSLLRGGIAERGGVRVGHRIIDINSQSVVAVPHDKIVNLLATSVGEIRMKTMPTSIFRLLTGQETPQYI